MKKLDVKSGSRFGKWTVLHEAKRRGRQRMFTCRCECGTTKEVCLSNLRAGLSTACGCHKTRHGMVGTRLYRIWRNMRGRCDNAKSTTYSYYGARGITLCDEWCDFVSFKEWALSNGYSDDLEIDRIDNAEGYTPANCRWTTKCVNQTNRRFTPGESGYVGVIKVASGWRASLQWQGKHYYLGTFPYPRFAALVRDKYIRDHKLPHKTQLPEPRAVA